MSLANTVRVEIYFKNLSNFICFFSKTNVSAIKLFLLLASERFKFGFGTTFDHRRPFLCYAHIKPTWKRRAPPPPIRCWRNLWMVPYLKIKRLLVLEPYVHRSLTKSEICIFKSVNRFPGQRQTNKINFTYFRVTSVIKFWGKGSTGSRFLLKNQS